MKKKIIWGVIAVIIIIAALIGILYFTTDMFKSPEQLFYKHLADDVNFFGKTTYSDVMKEVKKGMNTSNENVGEVTAKITSNDASTKQLATVLEKGKITYNIKTVGAEKKAQGDITLNYDGKDVTTLNFLQNKDQYGIKVADAYDKYVSVENNNLKALFQKLGVDTTNVPDRIEVADYYELLNIDDSTLKHIEDTYAQVIRENIPVESYSVEKNVRINYEDVYDETEVTTNAYKLSLTEEQAKTILVKLFETLKTDDTTLDLIVNKYNMMVEPYKTMGINISGTSELTKESLVKAIDDELEKINNSSASSKIALEIIAYGAKDGRTKVLMNILENEKDITRLEMSMMKDSEGKKVAMTASAEDTTIKILAADDKNTQGINMIAKSKDTEIVLTTKAENKKTDTVIEVNTDGTKMVLTVKDEVKSTENTTVEEFTTENSVKLNDMTQNEIVTLVQTIATNVQKVLPQKAQLLGINM